MIAMLQFTTLVIATMLAAAAAVALQWLFLRAAVLMRRPAVWKGGSTGGLRDFSLGTIAPFAFTRQEGRIRCGGGGAGSPPFPAGALAVGAATDGGGRPGSVDHGKFCGDSRRSGGRTRQRVLGRAPRHVVSRHAPDYAAGGFHRDLRHARTGVFDGGGRKSEAKG